MAETNWRVFKLSDLSAKNEHGKVRFQEFLRTQSLSCSLYHVPAGSKEMASAHEEDELYFVIEGRALLRVEDEEHVVEAGTIMYVRATCDHAFIEIEEDLTALAFFGAPIIRRPRGGP